MITPKLTPEALRAARDDATARFLVIAAALKAEAGVREHRTRKALTGRAWLALGVIEAPEGRTRRQLYIVAHECAHILLHGYGKGKGIPVHVRELQCEQWAHEALRRYGVPVPRKETQRAKRYVGHKIDKAERRGAKRINAKARAYAGTIKGGR